MLFGSQLTASRFYCTGDIEDMWIRDSSVQVGIYLSKIVDKPFLKTLVEGVLRTQAFYILQDPYANAFSSTWRPMNRLDKFERLLGRGGWVATRNYELDSSVYFIQLLWNYYRNIHVNAPERVVGEGIIFDAVHLVVNTWILEQHHDNASEYRYSELERNGLGGKVGYTGMTWSGFRPSDDANKYGYSIPSNIYAASALYKILELNARVWKSEPLQNKASKLLTDIEFGIEQYGIIEVEPGVKVYAYEVDGMGGVEVDFDDANLPSLLSLPLLGWPKLDFSIYKATRERLLDPKYNKYYFSGPHGIQGIGSQHTEEGFVWPLGVMTEALTIDSVNEKVRILRMLLKMQCGNGLMHESVAADDPTRCTRPEFEWANSLFVVLAESTLGIDCNAAADKDWRSNIHRQESMDGDQTLPKNGGPDDPLYHSLLSSTIMHSL